MGASRRLLTTDHKNLQIPSSNLGPLTVSISPDTESFPQSESFTLSLEDIHPVLRLGQGEKEKVVNAFGMWCAVVSMATALPWIAAMSFVNMLNKMNPDWDPTRAQYDKTGKIWAKTWLTLTNSYPEITGELEYLQENAGPCLFVANHASWLDIPVLCTVLEPVFKFIAKGELRKIPCIGQQLVGGEHILIDREDKRSQLKTFKDGIGWLRRGVPIMAFPEGKRSPDGRLMEFKGGVFSMASKAQVPIVPITISHTHAIMPCNSYFPVQPGKGKLKVHVHGAISSTGKSEQELSDSVKEVFLSSLPFGQHPAQTEEDGKTNEKKPELELASR